jgi:hypothetical protein
MNTRTWLASAWRGGPVGSHPNVGICRGVPQPQRAAANAPYVRDNIDLSLRQAFMLSLAGETPQPPMTVNRVTLGDH